MSTYGEFIAIAGQHRCEIVADFPSRSVRAECSCGWVGEQVKREQEALADHAAHVHVAAGLAVEDQNEPVYDDSDSPTAFAIRAIKSESFAAGFAQAVTLLRDRHEWAIWLANYFDANVSTTPGRSFMVNVVVADFLEAHAPTMES